MNVDLNKIRSLVEYNFATQYGLGDVPDDANMTKQEVWEVDKDPNDLPFTIREFRDMIAQCLYDILSDADSDGTNLSVEGTAGYGGGNKTSSSGNVLFEVGSTKYVKLKVDTDKIIEVDNGKVKLSFDTNKTIEVDNGKVKLNFDTNKDIQIDGTNAIINFGSGNNIKINATEILLTFGSNTYKIDTTKHTITGNEDVTGDLNISGTGKVLKIESTQVVKAQESSIANASVTVTETADSIYSSNEQNMLNKLKADVGTNKNKINTILTALRNHGLIAT